MRISDWSSDVCSSDLQAATYRAAEPRAAPKLGQPAASRYSQGTLGGPTLRKRSICRPECGDIGIACRHVGECVLRRLPTELASGSPTCEGEIGRQPAPDRKSVVEGKGVSVRVDLGGR